MSVLDWAYIGGGAYYHNVLDDPPRVNLATVQQMGDNTIALATAFGWMMLMFARFGAQDPKTNWARRLRLLLAGMAVGGLAFWLDGWVVPGGRSPAETSRDLVIGGWARLGPDVLAVGTGYLFYFGLVAAAAPWWKWTNRQRKERFRWKGPGRSAPAVKRR